MCWWWRSWLIWKPLERKRKFESLDDLTFSFKSFVFSSSPKYISIHLALGYQNHLAPFTERKSLIYYYEKRPRFCKQFWFRSIFFFFPSFSTIGLGKFKNVALKEQSCYSKSLHLSNKILYPFFSSPGITKRRFWTSDGDYWERKWSRTRFKIGGKYFEHCMRH